MAKATVLLFSNISILISYCPVRIVLAGFATISDLIMESEYVLSKVSKVIGVHNTVEKKKRLPRVIRRQAESPDSMRLKNLKDGLDRISHRRTISPSEYRKPMIRNRHWK